MKITEFIELMNNPKNKLLKADQLQATVAKTLEVKEYLSIKEKKELIDGIIGDCILYVDGVFKFNEIDKYVCFTMKTIEAYTNLEVSDDMEEDYDALCRAKLLNCVIESFNAEYENVKVLLQMKCDYMLSSNSIEAQLGRFLDGISDNINDVAVTVIDKIKEFNFDKLPIGAKEIGKILEFVNNRK